MPLKLLSRYGPFEFPPEMWPILDVNEEDGGAASASSTSDEESDPLNADWESVSCSIADRELEAVFKGHTF